MFAHLSINVTLPFQRPAPHQLCALNMQTSPILKAHAVHGDHLLGHTPMQILPSVTWIQSSDIYIDMVKLTLGWGEPQFFISWLLFAMWNCNTAFTCSFAFQMFCGVATFEKLSGTLNLPTNTGL